MDSNSSTDSRDNFDFDGLTTEHMEDLFRLETRNWLDQHGAELFAKQWEKMTEAPRKIVKPKIRTTPITLANEITKT